MAATLKKAVYAAGKVAVIVGRALLDGSREMLAAATEGNRHAKRRSHESDLTGEYNYRTGRLDDGTDPYGWYERD